MPELSLAVRESTLARFAQLQKAWDGNRALRTCYAHWYRRIRGELPPFELGVQVEIGSGPGLAREFIPELMLTDVVLAPWHARRVAAESLPFSDGEVGALVLFDVLHHVEEPARFFREASRVLAPGGRILMVEPYISLASRLVYGLFHTEAVDMSADPLVVHGESAASAECTSKDPFHSNQALPTLIFCRGRARRFSSLFPELSVLRVERFAGFSYPATGGFSRGPLLPLPLWRTLFFLEGLLPKILFRLFGFRIFVIIEKRPNRDRLPPSKRPVIP